MITREEDGEVVDPHIAVRIPNIPQQQGVADCGEWFHMSCVELETPPPETEPCMALLYPL